MTSIETVVAKFGLQLRRQGRELVGPCPTCGGRDRFAVNPSKQLWNCRVVPAAATLSTWSGTSMAAHMARPFVSSGERVSAGV
jgi:hypothetical protein